MTLTPILSASLPIQLHVVAALIGLTLGAYVLYRPRRDRLHKILGYIWVVAMAVLSLSSFAIPSHFTAIGVGPLHMFAVLTLTSLWFGVRFAIQRNFTAHEKVFRSLYSNGLVIAGAFTFLPGRTINRIIFADAPEMGWAVIIAVLLWAAVRVMNAVSGRTSTT